MAFALEVERAEKLAGVGTLTEAQAREILDGILKRAGTGESFRCPTAADFFREWLAGKGATRTPGTLARYTKVIELFLEHLGDHQRKPLASITPRLVEGFVSKRSRLGLSPNTIKVDASIVRIALNRARRQGLITTNPAEAVELPSSDAVEREAFTSAEVKMLVDAAEGEWKTLILLAYFSGARLGDCCTMTWESVDLANGRLKFVQRKTRAKNHRELVVPLHPELETHLNMLASSDRPEKYVMPGMASKVTGGRNGLSEVFNGIMRKAGVDTRQVVRDVGVRTLSRRTFHALRHSFASGLANAGVAPEVRMQLTGHKSAEVHAGYSHPEFKILADAMAKLPGLNEAIQKK